jgi:DNA-binding transcriptional LysR family regulator
MRLRHIEVFHAIYTTGSITNAAQLLHVSQPSVSKVLAHAESQLGFELFERVKSRLIPTEQAHALFQEVDKLYKQIRGVKQTAENIKKSRSGQLNIGLPPALGFDVIPAVVGQFRRAFPDVHITLHTLHSDTVHQALLEHKVDLAIAFSPRPMAGVTCQHLHKGKMVLVAPSSYGFAPATPVDLTALTDQELISIWDSGPLGDLLWARFNEHDIDMNSPIQVQTYFIAARLVAEQLGVCIIDQFTAAGNHQANTVMLDISPAITYNIDVLSLSEKPLNALHGTFITMMQRYLQTERA